MDPGQPATSDGSNSPAQSDGGLRRDLGFSIAVCVVVGNVIGSGIFLKPGNIAGAAGHFPTIISIWIAGGVLCLLGALCFAELATMLPQAGGLYVYLRSAYGRPFAFLFGWMEVVFGKPASIGALSVAFVGSLAKATGISLPVWGGVLLSALLVVGLAWINVRGVLWGGRMQLLTTFIKAGFLALVGLLPFALTPILASGVEFSNYSTTVTPREASLATQIGAVLLAVMWAYNGWHGITPLAEEVRNPQRTIPLALFAGIGILTFLYVTANLAYHGVLSMEEMQAAGDHAAEEMLEKLLGTVGLGAMSAVIMCSTFGAINSNLLQAPRVTFAMGRDRTFFGGLGRVHARYHTPAAAIVLMAIMSIALIIAAALGKHLARDLDPAIFQWELTRNIIVSLQSDSIFSMLTNFVIFSASIFYALGVAAVIVLRRLLPDAERPYRTWGYPFTPAAFLVIYLWFLYQVYLSNPLEALVSLALIGLGVPVYIAYQRFGTDRN